jgi:hypothetical protein
MKKEDTTQETRYLAQRVIWQLPQETKPFVRDSANCFLNAEKIKTMVNTIEWLSAIVCDDWSGQVMFNQIYDEISDYPILAFGGDLLPESWKAFCHEIAARTDKPIYYGKEEIAENKQQKFDSWKHLSIHETNFLYPKFRGFLSSLFCTITNKKPVYIINDIERSATK